VAKLCIIRTVRNGTPFGKPVVNEDNPKRFYQTLVDFRETARHDKWMAKIIVTDNRARETSFLLMHNGKFMYLSNGKDATIEEIVVATMAGYLQIAIRLPNFLLFSKTTSVHLSDGQNPTIKEIAETMMAGHLQMRTCLPDHIGQNGQTSRRSRRNTRFS